MFSLEILLFSISFINFNVNEALAAHFTPEGIKAQLEKYRIVPDVLEKAPKEELEVEYPGDLVIRMGNFVPLNRTICKPKLKWKADPKFYYSLVLVDADYVNVIVSQKVEYQLWMILNIPGGNITMGELLTEYMAPNPSKAHAYHRFVFMLWKHPFIHFRELRVKGGQLSIYRENFDSRRFIDKYEENGLGGPFAVNFFRTCPPDDDE